MVGWLVLAWCDGWVWERLAGGWICVCMYVCMFRKKKHFVYSNQNRAQQWDCFFFSFLLCCFLRERNGIEKKRRWALIQSQREEKEKRGVDGG